ncbi:LPS-assembly protein LptD [Gammaproteobacteria bacterium]
MMVVVVGLGVSGRTWSDDCPLSLGSEPATCQGQSLAVLQNVSDLPPAPAAVVRDAARIDQDLPWDFCGASVRKPLALPSSPTPSLAFASADGAWIDRRNHLAILQGGVVIDRDDQHLESDWLQYDRNRAQVRAVGNLYVQKAGGRILGEQGQIQLNLEQGTFDHAEYRMTGAFNARGHAAVIHALDRNRSQYEQLTYTTCHPGENTWRLDAKTLDIDRTTGIGVARNAVFRLKDIPLAYLPYMSFPIDNRRLSGFLTPTFGHSQRTGMDLTVPYYFNLAPQHDATLATRVMARRGAMLNGEYRFLTDDETGQFRADLMPWDRVREEARGALSIHQSGQFGPHWSSEVHADYVSDRDYLDDFGRDLTVSSARQLERRADFIYQTHSLYLLSRVQGFQTLDRSIVRDQRPYQRLPELFLGTGTALNGLQFHLDGEYDNFYQGEDRVHGQRLSLEPSVAFSIRRPWGYLTPALKLRYNTYALESTAPGQIKDPDLTLPTASLDSGLFFEREIRWWGQDSLQTLEPRLYYFYTPSQRQDRIPVFDAADLDFNFYNLFRDNRFAGRDRIGDANQLTLALTSRTLDLAGGQEWLRGGVGQILYFENRKIQMPEIPQESYRSAMVAEGSVHLNRDWSLRAGAQWVPNQDTRQTAQDAAQIHYETPTGHIFNAAYRYRTGDEQTGYRDVDLSFRWPVGVKTSLVGRWDYSLLHQEIMDAFAGIEYRECCWRFRALVRNTVNDSNRNDTSLMLQVEFPGLGGLGEDIDKFLEKGVYGYKSSH